MKRAALAALLALAGCKSSAPYTLPAAAINTGLAAGVSGVQRAAGGCYATCTHGTVCNPRTGWCEAAKVDEYCEEAPGGGMRCVPVTATPLVAADQKAPTSAALPIGISPATGSTPPPPSEASPRGP